MEKRYEGFLAPHGLYILDTHSGEVRFIAHGSNVTTPANASISEIALDFGNNTPTQTNQYSPFENEVIASYPYLIAKPFSDLLKETDARMKCKLMVDTFTAVLKYLALELASEYIRAKDLKDVQIHQTLTKDLSRPLISAWNLLIARCLPVMKDNKIELFSPEIKVAYEKLESKCKDPFLVTQSYSDENGEIKTKTKKLGKIQALINYRNGLAHGFNQSQTRAQKEFDEYYPLLSDILQEVRFVSRYTLWHVESSKQGVNGIRLMGASPSMKKVDFDREGVNPAVSPLFLINDATGEILPLYAFFDVDDSIETGLPEIGKDVFVFEGNTKNTVIYLSSSGEHLEKSSRFQHWKELLAQKQMDVEWADTKNLTLDTLRAIGKHISAIGIQALIASAKYLREATIPRQDLNELLDSFSYGDFNGFVLGGESGIGKSTLLAHKTEEWHADGHMVTFYRGSALNQSDIANKFLRDCALKVNYLEDFLSVVHPVISQTDKKCYLIIDALNEYAGDTNELIKSVENMVAQATNYPWFKIIVSIRDSAYNRANTKFGELTPHAYFNIEEEQGGEKVRTNIIRLQPIAKDFAEQLYNAYRDYKWKDSTDAEDEGYYTFRPLTEFKELDVDGSTVKLIRSPLMARLVMQSFHRAKLPQQLTNDEAMRLYYDNIVLEKSDSSPGFPERKKFLALLVTELDKKNSERIERDKLIEHNVLRPYLINNQRDSAYIQLLDLGVLMEEWEADDCYVRFAFDKFYEFLLAELHWPRIDDANSLIDLCRRATSFKILQGAIEIILIRFCSNNQSQQLVELIDLADEENSEVKELLKDTSVRLLVVLCSENPKLFEEVINEFPKQPSEMDLQILQILLDKLYLTGQLQGFEKSMAIATKEAELLGNQKVLSDLMLNAAQFDMLQGRYKTAREKLLAVIEIKKHLNDEYGRLVGMRKLGALEWREGNMEKSMSIFNDCLSASRENNFDDLTAAFLNNLGVLNGHFGKKQEQEDLYKQSLELKLKLGDIHGVSESYNNLGILYNSLGKINDALDLHRKALEIRRQLGDKKGISASLANLGSLYKDQGKFKEAEKLQLESLEIRRQLGDKKGISTSLSNLGNLYKDLGKIEEAEKLQLESLEIKRQLGDKKGISASLSNLGILYKVQGKLKESEKLHLESLEIRRLLDDKKGISSSLTNLGNLYKEQGKIEEALKLHLESLEIDRQLGNKKGISSSLMSLGNLYKAQGMIEEAEKLYLESLEIFRQQRDKKGISSSLSNLGIIYFEMGNDKSAVENLTESFKFKNEFSNSSGILASAHRVFSLLDKDQQNQYFAEVFKLDQKDFSAKENCWLTNIQLMHSCMNGDSTSVAEIKKMSEQIIDLSNQISINDIDDLPVESFFVAAKQLVQMNAPEEAKELAKQALEWIGNRKTRRKKELEMI
jgi:tetratricopeptide (TPR) repeat protein